MDFCKYSKILNCKTCDFVYHSSCKKFVLAHAKELSFELGDFKYKSGVPLKGRVQWSANENVAKSVALKYALTRNLKCKKYSMSQVISLALSNEVIDHRVIYIEYKSRVNVEADKLKCVLSSFVDSVLLQGACISIFVSPLLRLTLDYNKV